MASTTFVNYQTVIDAGWLNDVNSAVYSGTFQATTLSPTNITVSGAITANGTISGSGFSTYLASPPAIGGTTAAAGAFTTLSASSTVSGTGFSTYLASPPAIGGTTAAAGSFTTLSGSTSTTTPIVQSSGSLLLKTNGTTTAVTIDTSQNVGIGVTPGAWSQGKVVEIGYTGNAFWGYSASQNFISQNAYYNGSAWKYTSSNPASYYTQNSGTHNWQIASSGTSGNSVTFTQAMTLDNSGNLLVGTTSGSNHIIYKNAAVASRIIAFQGENSGAYTSVAFATGDNQGWNSANTVQIIGKNSGTGRSINAAGTVNQNGADYAEYMTKAGNFTINKGDICGIDVNGKLTNVFANAISFVVKSTNPGLVGGDVWGTEEALGLTAPQEPTRSSGESDAYWATAQANYQTALSAYKIELATALESARQLVDRIAFSGQVPVNVTGATAGQYIVPIAKQDGSIGGEAVSESAITLQQYMQSVGKVISVENNVTTIIVKVA